MKDELKTAVLEIAEIAQSCPEPFRQTCFELLLKDHLEQRKRKYGTEKQIGVKAAELSEAETKQKEIQSSDVHVKVKSFLKKNELSVSDLNELFYKDEEDFLPLFDDLKSTSVSETQIRASLLQALIYAMNTGDFEFDGEAVRAECQDRKAYNPANFSRNFKNNSSLFENFVKYIKGQNIKLSEEGKTRLAALIRELSE